MPGQTTQLKKRNRELAILNAVAHALNQSIDLPQALDAALENVADLLDLSTSWIWLIDEDTGDAYLAASRNLPPALRDNPARMEGWCYCLDTYRKGDLKGAANVNVVACSRLKPLISGTDGLRFHASIPLYANRKKIGVLNVASPRWRKLSAEDLRLLNTVGDLVSIALERAQLFGKSVRLGALEERYRLARELHDTLGQGLAAILLRLETLDARLAADTDRTRLADTVRDTMALTRATLEEARRAVRDLRAAPLDNQSLADALNGLAQTVESETGLDVRFSDTGTRPLPVHIASGLYRMAQEALNNIVRHAGAQTVRIHLRTTPDRVCLTLEDDGRGFDPERIPEDHYGLIGLNERARLLNGALTVESAPSKGTRLDVRIPLEQPS